MHRFIPSFRKRRKISAHAIIICSFLSVYLLTSCLLTLSLPFNLEILDLITFMSFKFFVKLIEGNPVPFAVNYTVGNTLALSASTFLCGPKRQFKNMFDERRKLVSTVYLSCLACTLVVVFIPLPWALKLATLLCLLITQFGANIWYSLSYIPYGRKTALKFVKKFFGISNNSGGDGFMGLGGSGELA